MSARLSTSKQGKAQPFDPASTGTLNASETLKLLALPDDTRIYFGHEYTEKNLRFALTLEPENAPLIEKHAWAVAQIGAGQTTTPTTIASEKATNPFLRWNSRELRATLAARFPDLPMDDVHVFARTRELKDSY